MSLFDPIQWRGGQFTGESISFTGTLPIPSFMAVVSLASSELSRQNICAFGTHLAKCFVDRQADVLSFFLAAFFKNSLALLHLLRHPLQVEEVGDVDTELAVLAVEVQGSVEVISLDAPE